MPDPITTAEAMREACAEIAEAYKHIVRPEDIGDDYKLARYSNGTCDRIASAIRALPLAPESRSIQRREALQRGEEMPEFPGDPRDEVASLRSRLEETKVRLAEAEKARDAEKEVRNTCARAWDMAQARVAALEAGLRRWVDAVDAEASDSSREATRRVYDAAVALRALLQPAEPAPVEEVPSDFVRCAKCGEPTYARIHGPLFSETLGHNPHGHEFVDPRQPPAQPSDLLDDSRGPVEEFPASGKTAPGGKCATCGGEGTSHRGRKEHRRPSSERSHDDSDPLPRLHEGRP